MRSSILLLVAACATSAPAKTEAPATSRGLRADAHLAAARDHQRRAQELRQWPEVQRSNGFVDPSSGLWYRAWDTAGEHDALAVTHREQAARLHAAYEEACANIPSDHVRVSPLVRLGEGGMATSDGVVVYLRPEIAAGDLLAELRCHRAWMMLGDAGMDACPLDLAKIRVQAHGDATGISVEITVPDPQLVPELQRRTARDLEIAGTRNATH